jgi:hypothetical protein
MDTVGTMGKCIGECMDMESMGECMDTNGFRWYLR